MKLAYAPEEQVPSFLIASNGHLVSSYTASHALMVGDRLTVSRPIDLGYMAQIEAGECGTVVDVEPTEGGVEVLMDVIHKGLYAWGNCILLMPFMTDDTIDAFCRIIAV